MKRQATLPPPQTRSSASVTAAVTSVWNAGNRSQVTAVSKVSEITAALAEAYPQSAAEVTDEVPTIIDQLVEGGVLECS